MARKPTATVAPKQTLSIVEMRRGIERLEQRIADIDGFDIGSVQSVDTPPALVALSKAIEGTLAKFFGENTADYNRFHSDATDVTPVFYGVSSNYPRVQHAVEQLNRKLPRAKAVLQEAINTLKEEITDAEADEKLLPVPAQVPTVLGNKIFVVHGHDEGARDAVARFLGKLGLEAIILQEQPDRGFTIIEKFETYASQVSFAVVLLTPDDIGGLASASVQAVRARQNVIFELGYFVGKLGRGQACLLRKGDVEIPSDLYGVIYSDMDAGDG